MITTTEFQEKTLDQYGALINPSKTRLMRDAGLGIVESRREGPYVWDQSDVRYIDCRDDAGIYNIGRRNPDVIAKLKQALDTYDIGNSRSFSEPRVRLAEKLTSLSPERKLKAVAYGASGSEVIAFAIKLARSITGRTKVIAMSGGYHDVTGVAQSVGGHPPYLVPFGDIEALKDCLDREAIDAACVLIEPVQSHDDVIIPPEGYLHQVRELCSEFGALMIVDEIQTGLGRTGELFACQAHHVVPDILVLGKALSGGLYPISAALFRRSYLRAWDGHPITQPSAFAGSDLGCLTALATLEVIEKQRLPERARELEMVFQKGFADLRAKYPRLLKSFHCKGLLMRVEFTYADIGPQMSRDLSQNGVLAGFVPLHPERMKLMPSLIIDESNAAAILKAFDTALAGFRSVPTVKQSGIDQVIEAIS